jgi:transposase
MWAQKKSMLPCHPIEPNNACVRPTFTSDLRLLTELMKVCHITTVAMEATGVYRIPLFEMLEEKSLEGCLLNARHLRNVCGRKTDVLDCQLIQQLHTYGLLNPSFRPPEQIVTIRSLV